MSMHAPHMHVHKGLGRASRTHVNPNQLIIMVIKYCLFTSSFRYYYVIPHSLLNKQYKETPGAPLRQKSSAVIPKSLGKINPDNV